MAGKHGGADHENILNLIRGNFLTIAEKYTGNKGMETGFLVLADEYLMLSAVDEHGVGGRKKGGRIPDLVILTDDDPVVVEIGKFNPDKWRMELPVVHVGFKGTVTPIYGGTFKDRESGVLDFIAGMIEECLHID